MTATMPKTERRPLNVRKALLASAITLLAALLIVGGLLLLQRTPGGVIVDPNQYRDELVQELTDRQGEYDERSIVLTGTNKVTAKKLAKQLGADLRITSDGSFATLTLPEGVTFLDIAKTDEYLSDLPKMSIDYEARISEIVEEEESSSGERLPMRPQYEVTDGSYELQTYLDYLNMKNLWSYTKGYGVTVAVIDTGIDTDHPEFAGRISEYSYNATEDKIVKDWLLEDGSYDWSLIEDEQGHGTSVAGVIGASMNNGEIVGIAPEVTLLVIKAECDDYGNFKRTSDLVFGLYYAIERDVSVVNMSFGGYDSTNPFKEPAQLAFDNDIICVAAAGNDATANLCYPAADENVFGIGALATDSWELADYSNYGENVDFVAPGTTYTTKMGGGYATTNGTSLACPTAVGVIALYMSQNRYQEVSTVEELLRASSYDLGDLGPDWYYGYGAIDAYALIRENRGTITFNMMTDELDNTEQTFIRNHTLQDMPVPERLYAIFDGWYYDPQCTEEYVWYEDEFSADLTLYANWVNEEDGVPYIYVELDDGTIEIRAYTGHRRYITIPDYIDGKVVSSIGEGAFAGETNLREVNLPKYLVRIRDRAFLGCANLIKMNIPDTVTAIGAYAFCDNVRLSSVAFGENSQLMTIGDFAFKGCGKMRSFAVPQNVTYLNGSAFFGATSMQSFAVQEGSETFFALDGVLLNHTMTSVVCYPAGKSGEYILPETVTTIDVYAFAFAKISQIELANVRTIESVAFIYSRLESLTIPDSVTQLGNSAFASCEYLQTLTIGHGLTEIPGQAFYNCTDLQSVEIPNTIQSIGGSAFFRSSLYQGVTFEANSSLLQIGASAFENTYISSVEIPASVVSIEGNAFSYCYALNTVTFASNSNLRIIGRSAFMNDPVTQIELPNRLEEIGSFAFSNTLLQTVNVPASLTTFGAGAFASCHALENIYVDDANAVYTDIDGVVYDMNKTTLVEYPAGKTKTEYTVRDGVTSIGDSAFYGTQHLQYCYLPEGVKTINSDAYRDCTGLRRVHMLEGLEHIYAYAFYNTINIERVDLPDSVIVLDEYSFYGCGARQYKLSNNLQEIKMYALSKNSRLTSIAVPDSVMQISNYAFAEDWNLRSITFTDNSKLPRISYEAFAFCGLTSFRVPANVSTMAQGAFKGCSKLTSFTFAANSKLGSISAYMFDGCSNLQSITFEEGSSLTSVQAHGLEGMTKLQSLDFGDAKLTNIDNFAFRFCESLTRVDIPEGVTNLGRFAFYGCTSLSEVQIPSTMEHIGRFAFLGTNELSVYFVSDTLPLYLEEDWDHGTTGYYLGVSDVITAGDWKYATLTNGGVAILKYFGNATELDLTTLDLGGNIVNIGGKAFYFSTLESIKLPDTLTTIQPEVFYHANLKSITIPESVQFIGRSAFAYTPITSLTFEGNSKLTVMEQSAFENTEELSSVVLPKSLTTIGRAIFKNSGITVLTFEQGIGITEISEEAFAYTDIKTLTIPDYITLINHNAFRNTAQLESVSFGSADFMVMSNAFYQSGLKSLNIPANMIYVGEYAFVALPNLTEFTVDAANPYYTAVDGLLVGQNGRKLIAVPAGKEGSLTVPAGIEVIGFGAFEDSKLSEITFLPDANILSFGYRAFYNAKNITNMHIPAGVVAIDYYAFANCSALETVTFAESNGLNGVYEGAFYGCKNLTNILLPDAIDEISDFAFYGCRKLTRLPVSDNSGIKGIYSYAMAYSGLAGEFTTPATLYDIGDYAFLGTRLTKVTIPDTNAWDLVIGIGAFEECNVLEEITLPFIGASFEDPDITWFGYIFGAGTYQANVAYVPASLTQITLIGDLTELGAGAFYNLDSIKELILPENISVLGESCFAGTTVRYTITNPVLGKVKDVLGNNSYMLNSSMFGQGFYGHLIIDDLVSTLSFGTFENLDGLTGVTIGKGIKEIPHSTFWGCHNLAAIVIPDNVTTICEAAFYNCTRLKYVEIGSKVQCLDPNAFRGCSIEEFNISEDNVHYQIIDGVVYDNPVTQIICVTAALPPKVVIPEGLTRIPMNTFYSNVVLEIVFPDSVEIIESSAVICDNLQTITLGKELVTIEWYAFGFPENLQVINNNSSLPLAFDNEDELTRTAMLIVSSNGDRHYRDPESGYETIDTANGFRFSKSYGQYTLLSYLGSETSIVLPESIQGQSYTISRFVSSAREICMTDGARLSGTLPFNGCGFLQSFTVAEGCENYCTVDGVLYNADLTQLLAVPKDITSKVTVPGSVESIPYRAFAETSVTEVTLSEGVTNISREAFDQCSKLQYVSLPNTLLNIGRSAFMACEALLEIDIPSAVRHINEFAFYECVSLERVMLHEGLQMIGNVAFDRCKSLKKVALPNGLEIIGSGAFHGCHEEFEISIPDSIQQMTNAFDSSATLKFSDSFVTIDGIVYNRDTMSIVHAYRECITGRVEIPYGVTEIPSDIFNATTVTEVILPDSVHTLASSVFSSCMDLRRVVLSSALTSIPDNAFYQCASLTEIVIPEGVKSVGSYAFYSCALLRRVDIPDSLRTIEYGAFYDCVSLESLTLPSEFVSFKDGAFQGCSSLELLPASDMQHYTVVDGIWYADDMKTIAYISTALSGDVIIAKDVVNIGSALIGHSEITSITLPDSFSLEYPYSFSVHGCDKLQAIYVSDTHPLYTSIDGVLYDKDVTRLLRVPVVCDRLEIAEGVTVIPNTAFETGSVSSLNEIVLPSTLLEINDTFMHLYGIKVIYNHSILPIACQSWDYGGIALHAKVVSDANGNTQYADGVWEYDIFKTDDGFVFERENGEYTLLGYEGEMETVTLPISINGHSYKIYKFFGATHVIIPDGWTKIPEDAFANSAMLTSVSLPASVVTIGNSAFLGCKNLKSVTLPKGLERIENNAFAHCFDLASPTFPSTLVYLGDYAYGSCGLASIRIPANILEFGNGVFNECINLTEVILEEGLTSLPGFSYCTALAQIDIPQSVSSIGISCFEGCTALTEITIPDNVTSIGAKAFMHCTSLSSITVGDKIKTIGKEAFLNTAFYKDPDNWTDNVLYLNCYLIRVKEDVKYFELAENVTCVAEGAYDHCYMLKIAYAFGQIYNLLATATNIETLVILDSMPTRLWNYFGWSSLDIPLTLKNVVLEQSVRMQYNVFGDESGGWITGLNIFVERLKQDTQWDENYPDWQKGNRVYYGEAWKYVRFYGAEGALVSKEFLPNAQIIRVPWIDHYTNGSYVYIFCGFDMDCDGVADTIPATSTLNINATAVFRRHCGHVSVTDVVEQQVTCTEHGYGYTICNHCQEKISEWTREALGHDYQNATEIEAPTCLKDGEEHVTCTVCGHELTRPIPALGHDTIHHEAKQENCTEYGWNAYEACSRCNYTTYVEIPATGHSHKVIVTAPTCTEKGYTTHTCHCGHTYVDSYVDALDHSFGAWSQTDAPTCTEVGEERRDCDRCDHFETREIEAIGHDYDVVEKEEIIDYTCKVCGHHYTEEIVRDPVSLTNTLFTTAWGMDFATAIEAKAPIAKGAKFHLYYNREVATFVSAVGSDKITIDTSVAGELTVKVLEDIAVGEKLMDLNFKTFEYLNTGSYTLLSVDENSKPLCEFTNLVIYQMGDVNMDGGINSRDVLMIKQFVVKMIELTDVQKIYANVYVDTDKDGQPLINSRDAMLIQQYVVRMPVELGDRITLTFVLEEGEQVVYSIRKGEALTDVPAAPEGYAWSMSSKELVAPDFTGVTEMTTYYLMST